VALDTDVFINCPFDEEFLPLLHAVAFAIHDCGFTARTALEDTGGSELRLDKIRRLIGESKYSIHDLSRIELAKRSRLPRFNMAFECGLAYGSIKFDPLAQDKDLLVVAAVEYQDKQTTSDLSGMDPGYHRNEPQLIIAEVRKFLVKKSPNKFTRGAASIFERLTRFEADLPAALAALPVAISLDEVRSIANLHEWIELASAWMAVNPT